jgi:formylmethanofuran dehydrogenase subunit E
MKCLVIILLFFSFSSIFAQEKFTKLFELEIEKDFIQTKIANNELFLTQKLEKLATKKERLDTEDDMQEIFLISKSKRKLQDSIKVLNTTLLEKSQLIQRDIYKKILKLKKREKVKYKKIRAKSIEDLKSVKNDKQLDSYSKDQLEKERIEKERIKKEVEQKNFLIEQDKIKEALRVKEVEDSLTLLKNLKAQELTLLKEKQDSLEIEKKATILKNRALLKELAKQDTLIEKQVEPTVEIVKENKLSVPEILEKMRLAKEKASQKSDTIVKNSDSTAVTIETKKMSVNELIAERAKLRHEQRQAEKVKEEQIQEQLLIDKK